MTAPQQVRVVIASPLEPEHVAVIRAVDDRIGGYDPSLLAVPQYVVDGTASTRSSALPVAPEVLATVGR